MASGTDGTMTSRADGVPTGRPAPGSFVSLPELRDIHFDFDKYDIRQGEARILEANAKWLKANPDYLVLIEGHCDERGTNEYNLALGDRRAKATMNYLLAHGVAANRIHIISYGEERPLCSEKNEACWTRNRRAHFGVKAM
jgi:peptidoglycan-associated lipoprotein